jgi:hypothetical protein
MKNLPGASNNSPYKFLKFEKLDCITQYINQFTALHAIHGSCHKVILFQVIILSMLIFTTFKTTNEPNLQTSW